MYKLTLYETAEALGISFNIINISGGLDLFFLFGGKRKLHNTKVLLCRSNKNGETKRNNSFMWLKSRR